MTAQELAVTAAGSFTTGKRDNGDVYTKTTADAPDWVTGLVREAHGDMLPDDWKYACIASACEWLAENDDWDETHEWADGEVDVYNSDRATWLSSSVYRAGYVDEGTAELGSSDQGVHGDIGIGQYYEAMEIMASVQGFLVANGRPAD